MKLNVDIYMLTTSILSTGTVLMLWLDYILSIKATESITTYRIQKVDYVHSMWITKEMLLLPSLCLTNCPS